MLHAHICILIWTMVSIAMVVLFIIATQIGIDAISCTTALCAVVALGGLTISIIGKHDIQAMYMLRLDDKITYCEQLLQRYGLDYPNISSEKEEYEQERDSQRKLMDYKYIQNYEEYTIQVDDRRRKYEKLKAYEQLLND